jgi:hypothetical protein
MLPVTAGNELRLVVFQKIAAESASFLVVGASVGQTDGSALQGLPDLVLPFCLSKLRCSAD